MPRQTQFGGDFAGIQEAIVFYRPAKSQQRTVQPERQPIESSSELQDVGELLDHIRHHKLRYPIPLTESKMDEPTSDQIQDILLDSPNDINVKFLLSLFCSNLQGKQLMKNKYAMLVYVGDALLLAHVRADKGMSLKEEEGEIELIRRFLDVDNILSAALFEIKNDEIVFSHFTDTGSDAFRNFLGVRPRQYHYDKKNIQIICFFHGNRDIEAKFEFTNDEFDKLWLQEHSVKLSANHFTPVENERSHEIKEIRWGNEDYESIDRFKSDFKEYTLGLDAHRTRYDRLHQYPSDGVDYSVYSADEVNDQRDYIEVINEDGESEIINKNNIADDLFVIYANKHIEIDSGFADDILQDLVNNLERNIYHPSEDAAPNEFKVNNITFLNIDENDLTSELKEFVRRTHDHAINRSGETLSKCLLLVLLHVLEREIEESYQNAIEQIINVNTGNPKDRAVVSTKENERSGLIEYKNAKSLEVDDPAQNILDYIKTEKRKENNTKIFLFGFTEQNRQIEGFDTQSWNDDRVSQIEKEVKAKLNDSDISYENFMLQIVELGDDGDRWAIIGMIY